MARLAAECEGLLARQRAVGAVRETVAFTAGAECARGRPVTQRAMVEDELAENEEVLLRVGGIVGRLPLLQQYVTVSTRLS